MPALADEVHALMRLGRYSVCGNFTVLCQIPLHRHKWFFYCKTIATVAKLCLCFKTSWAPFVQDRAGKWRPSVESMAWFSQASEVVP